MARMSKRLCDELNTEMDRFYKTCCERSYAANNVALELKESISKHLSTEEAVGATSCSFLQATIVGSLAEGIPSSYPDIDLLINMLPLSKVQPSPSQDMVTRNVMEYLRQRSPGTFENPVWMANHKFYRFRFRGYQVDMVLNLDVEATPIFINSMLCYAMGIIVPELKTVRCVLKHWFNQKFRLSSSQAPNSYATTQMIFYVLKRHNLVPDIRESFNNWFRNESFLGIFAFLSNQQIQTWRGGFGNAPSPARILELFLKYFSEKSLIEYGISMRNYAPMHKDDYMSPRRHHNLFIKDDFVPEGPGRLCKSIDFLQGHIERVYQAIVDDTLQANEFLPELPDQ